MTAPRTTRRPAAQPSWPVQEPGSRWLGAGLVLLGLGAAALAVLGPLVTGVIRYPVSEGARNQVVGGDVAGLVLVAPVALAAGVLALRRHPAGPVLAQGPAAYALYMYAQLALGGDPSRYEGNVERFFPLLLGLFVLAGAVAVRAWTLTDPDRLPPSPRWLERTLAAFFLAVAAFLALGLHLPGLVAVWQGQPGPEYLADPVVFWLVKFMDLGLVVPLLAAVAAGLLRARRWARGARYAAASWAALLGSSVAGMAIVMQVSGDPAASAGNTIAFGAFALVALGLAALLHARLLRPTGDRVAGTRTTAVRQHG